MSSPTRQNDSASGAQSKGRATGAAGRQQPRKSLIVRAQTWVLTHRIATVLVASFMSIVTVTGLILWLSTITPPPPSRRPPTPADALIAWENGDDATATRLAERFHADEQVAPTNRFIAPYVLGMLVAKQAKPLTNRPRVRQFALAARMFEESFAFGWPDEQMAAGLRTWGLSLLESRQVVAARDVLKDALRQPKQNLADVERLLVEALAADPGANLTLALAHNATLLKLPELTDVQRQQETLERARLLVRANRRLEAETTLAQIPANSPLANEATIARAHILLDHARQLADQAVTEADPADDPAVAKPQNTPAELATRALELLTALPTNARASRQDMARVSLLTARAHAMQDKMELAQREFGQIIANYSNMSEAWAAMFEEAELLCRQERDEDALQGYLRALAEVRHPEPFRNPWFTIEELRRRLALAFDAFLSRRQFDLAVRLIEAATPVLPPDRAALLIASTHSTWAQSLAEQAQAAPPIDAEKLADDSRAHFRAAGNTYYKLARLRFTTRQYPDDIWEAAQNFLAGQDYQAATKMYEHCIQLGIKARREPALLGLTEALIGQDQLDQGLETLDELLRQQGNDPSAYQARLLAARIHWQRGEVDEAVSLLQKNIASDLLTPAARQWRDSLWTLCQVLFDERRYSDAIPRLEEACQRWPQASQTVELTYMLAESYRQLGHQARREADRAEATLPRQQATRRALEHFEASLPPYQQAIQSLSALFDKSGLTAGQQHMLRDCVFSRGLVQYELGRYDEAIATYRNAASRYQDTTESLEALVRISACYRRMGRDDLARHTLLQAKAALHQLELAGAMTKTSTYSTNQWNELLQALGTL